MNYAMNYTMTVPADVRARVLSRLGLKLDFAMPAMIRGSLLEDLTDVVMSLSAELSNISREAYSDRLYELADSAVPVYTSDRFVLAAEWPACWQSDDVECSPSDLVQVLGEHIYSATLCALLEAAPLEAEDFAFAFGVPVEVVELAREFSGAATLADAIAQALFVADWA